MKLKTKNFKGVYMKTLLSVLLLLTVSSAFGSVRVTNSSNAQLGSFVDVKCGYGLSCSQVAGKMLAIPNMGSGSDFASGDTSPAVDAGGPFFKTFEANTVTIASFDGTVASGQEIIVLSQGPVTFDVTGTQLKCGSTDLVTSASGDITRWIKDGSDWRCTSFIDASDNLN